MSTFRDPIIYPGAPMPPRSWATHVIRTCVLGNHTVKPGARVQRFAPGTVACTECMNQLETAR